MAYAPVPNIFANQVGPIPLAELDANFSYLSGKVVSVADYSPIAGNTGDNTAIFQLASDTLISNGGGVLLVPPGHFRFTGTWNITAGKVTIQGSGRDATILDFANGSNDCITVNSGTTQLFRSNIYDLTITGTGKTGGRAVYLAYFGNCNIERVDLQTPYNGIEVYVTNSIILRDVLINGPTNTSGYCVYWHAPSDGSARSDVLVLDQVTGQCNYSGTDGIILDGLVQTLKVYGGSMLACKRNLWVRNTGASATNVPGFIDTYGFDAEGATLESLRIEGGFQFRFFGGGFVNLYGASGQGSADDYAVNILDDASHSITNSIKFVGVRMGLCAKEAFYSGARDVQLIGCTTPSAGLLTSNTYPSIHALSPAQDWIIDGTKDNEWGSTNQVNYTLQIDSGVSRVVANSDYFFGGLTGAVLNNSSSTQIIIGTNGSTKNPVPMRRGIPLSNSTASGATLTAAQMLCPQLLRSGPAADFSDTTPTAAAMVAAMTGAAVDACFTWICSNSTAHNQTIQPGSGVTFGGNVSGGNFVIAGGGTTGTRTFTLQVTACVAGSEAITMLG